MKPKKCKICKSTFQPFRSLQMVCSAKCGIEYTKQLKQKDWTKRKKKLKDDLLTVQDLTKIAQTHFNNYIRERDKGQGCISCGAKLVGKFDAGHFYSAGGHTALRFDERNVHGQCVACNQHKHGNLHEYRKGILKRLDGRILADLDKRAQDTIKFTREGLRAIIEEYKTKLKELKSEKGL